MKRNILSFDQVWEDFIIPLEGQTIKLANGGENQITIVNSNYLRRISSQGNSSEIPKKIFNEVYNDLIQTGLLTRASINEKYKGRRSSVIVALLGTVPGIHLKTNPVTIIMKAI